jgi:hypothetical protein
MFKSYLHRKIAAMERAFSYDAAYVHEMLDASASAFMKFAMFQKMAAHCDSVSRDAWYAAKLAAVIAEDCGPCAQLTVDMALQAGVDPKIIAALTRGDFDRAGPDAALGYRYGLAVATNSPEAVALSVDAEAKYGRRGLVSLALAVAGARVYPTLKRGLGHGASCQKLVVADDTIAIRRAA